MKIVFAPDWFLSTDIIIHLISFLVLGLFFALAFKSYKLSNKKSTLYLGVGFLLISLAELSTILTKFVLYYDTSITTEIGRAIITSQIVKTVDIFYYLGFSFYKILTLLGLYVIYKLPMKKIPKDFYFDVYLLIAAAVLSQFFYYVFHFTALLLLLMIIRNYYRIYMDEKNVNTKILIWAFSILALSQTIFAFSKLNYLYVTAQSVQLASYIILLALIVRIVKNGKKKKPHGDNA